MKIALGLALLAAVLVDRRHVTVLAARGELPGLRDLVVGRPFRRNGIGTMLIQRAMEWAAEQGLHHLTLEMQSKNYPAIRFCKKHGFTFCGFNEYYYPSQDVALFFSLRLR